mgnify:CR=1 FL=1
MYIILYNIYFFIYTFVFIYAIITEIIDNTTANGIPYIGTNAHTNAVILKTKDKIFIRFPPTIYNHQKYYNFLKAKIFVACLNTFLNTLFFLNH